MFIKSQWLALGINSGTISVTTSMEISISESPSSLPLPTKPALTASHRWTAFASAQCQSEPSAQGKDHTTRDCDGACSYLPELFSLTLVTLAPVRKYTRTLPSENGSFDPSLQWRIPLLRNVVIQDRIRGHGCEGSPLSLDGGNLVCLKQTLRGAGAPAPLRSRCTRCTRCAQMRICAHLVHLLCK